MLGTSWKTSLIGWLMIGGDIIAFIAKTLEQQAIPNSLFEWVAFGMGIITGIGLILAKDRDVTGLPKAVPVVLLCLFAIVGLSACSTYHDGRAVTAASDEPGAYGGLTKVENCFVSHQRIAEPDIDQY